MKKILLVTILLLNQSVFAVSEETSQKLFANITMFNIGHDFIQGTNVGEVVIDLQQKQIALNLIVTPTCDAGMLCAMILPEPTVIEVPLVSVTNDGCGDKYTAEIDKTPVDGLYEKIEVVDYSKSVCLFVRPMDTWITYESLNPWTQTKEVSTFEAQTLKMLPDFH